MDHKPKESFLESMSPAQVFTFGIIEGILVLCTIGFFILLGLLLSGGSFGGGDKITDDTARIAPPTDDGGIAPSGPTNISLREVDERVDHIRGNKNANITLVEYTDFECPFCKRFHQTMLQVMAKYGDDVRWVNRNFPLDSLHRQARIEANAAECAGEQGKYWEFVDLIFEKTPSNDGLDLALLPQFAEQVGLNMNKYNTCVEQQKYAQKIQADEQDAQQAGGSGTPYSIIIGPDGQLTPINGAQPFGAVEAALKQYLN